MQLHFIESLYKARKTKPEINLVKNIEILIKNLKYLRANLETKLSYIPDNHIKFDDYSRVTTSISFALYWLATLGYIKNQEVSGYNIEGKEAWYKKTEDSSYLSSSKTFSDSDLYRLGRSIESLSNQFLRVHTRLLNSTTQSTSLIGRYKGSLSDIINQLHTIKS